MSQLPVPNPPNPVPASTGGLPFDFNSPYRIVKFAMRDAGILQEGDEPNSDNFQEYMPRLNELFNFYQTQGLKLWLQEIITITCTQGKNLYVFGPSGDVIMPRPPRFLEGYWQDFLGNRRPLIVLSRNEWDTLSTLVTQGSVNSYFIDKQQLTTNLYLWLTPDLYSATQGTVNMLAQVQINNVIGLYDTMNFPQEWFIALHWGLADQISTGQPQAIIDRCSQMATKYLTMLEDWDVEDASTTFQPDQRNQYVGYRFR